MVDVDEGAAVEHGRQQAAESAFRRAAHGLEQARAAQRSAARSVDESADSHDRVAKAYEDAADHAVEHRPDLRERAARHRRFAQEDHQMAQQIRENAEE